MKQKFEFLLSYYRIAVYSEEPIPTALEFWPVENGLSTGLMQVLKMVFYATSFLKGVCHTLSIHYRITSNGDCIPSTNGCYGCLVLVKC